MDKKLINIALCYDDKFWMEAGVAITSLLCVSKDKCNYNIYCVISSSVNKTMQNILESLVKKHSASSNIKFFAVIDQLNDVRFASMYYRLLLPQILFDIDKIIYSDIDVVFNLNLQELDSIDVNSYYIAGVKDFNKKNFKNKLWNKYNIHNINDNGQYINSGILVMNLKKIRQDNIDKKWLYFVKENFPFHDQDIINVSCKGKILFLPSEYNFLDINAKVLHFSGNIKPWNVCEGILKYSELWWYYAAKTEFYPYFLKNITQKQCENIFKILPKWLGKFICWFIFKREKRRCFIERYVKGL
ncbi:MAG: glycosyltransferase family 8 protein [Endomicrobium sp.]|jgi:lipopolysaccharide biosynthesis glycosyltransferase|nr:glycosyltransferase family 8 protein [Endomicrobium sp.]